jgi:hypothetical protein
MAYRKCVILLKNSVIQGTELELLKFRSQCNHQKITKVNRKTLFGCTYYKECIYLSVDTVSTDLTV